jgi:hypothetical protein
MRQVVIDKSIQRGRLVYKLKTSLVFEYLFMYFLAWVLPFATVMVWLNPLNNNSYVFNGFAIAIDLWLLIGLYFTNKLIVVKGASIEINKEIILKVLEAEFPEISFSSGNPNLLRGQKPEGWNRYGKIVTVILKDNSIYINILNTFRGGSFSFPHRITNYITARSIAETFKLTLQQTWQH